MASELCCTWCSLWPFKSLWLKYTQCIWYRKRWVPGHKRTITHFCGLRIMNQLVWIALQQLPTDSNRSNAMIFALKLSNLSWFVVVLKATFNGSRITTSSMEFCQIFVSHFSWQWLSFQHSPSATLCLAPSTTMYLSCDPVWWSCLKKTNLWVVCGFEKGSENNVCLAWSQGLLSTWPETWQNWIELIDVECCHFSEYDVWAMWIQTDFAIGFWQEALRRSLPCSFPQSSKVTLRQTQCWCWRTWRGSQQGPPIITIFTLKWLCTVWPFVDLFNLSNLWKTCLSVTVRPPVDLCIWSKQI